MMSSVGVLIAYSRQVVALALPIAIAACAQVTQDGRSREEPTPPVQEAERPSTAMTSVPKPLVATSADGTKIVYEVAGAGPALVLVHGGGQIRKSWNQLGYVDRLSKRFTVITMDLRGHGDSDKPATSDAYALDRVLADLLAVADAAGSQRFHLWGFGHGATIGRYLAARSDRVISAVLVGTPMGPPVTGIFKDAVISMRAKWQPLLQAQAAGTLDMKTLSPGDRSAWESGVANSVLFLGALTEYPPLEPTEIKAPTLWLVGSDGSVAMENVKDYEGKLAGTSVTFKLLSGASYADSFVKIDQVLAEVEPFLAKVAAAGGGVAVDNPGRIPTPLAPVRSADPGSTRLVSAESSHRPRRAAATRRSSGHS